MQPVKPVFPVKPDPKRLRETYNTRVAKRDKFPKPIPCYKRELGQLIDVYA